MIKAAMESLRMGSTKLELLMGNSAERLCCSTHEGSGNRRTRTYELSGFQEAVLGGLVRVRRVVREENLAGMMAPPKREGACDVQRDDRGSTWTTTAATTERRQKEVLCVEARHIEGR